MARQFIYYMEHKNGLLVQQAKSSVLSDEDLPRPDPANLRPGTGLGAITVDEMGRITRVQFLPPGTYYSLTITDASVSGSTTAPSGSGPARLFTSFVDAGNTTSGTEVLQTNTLTAGQLATNGDVIEVVYGGFFVGNATATKQITVELDGSTVFDTGTLTLAASSDWSIRVTMMRASSTEVRTTVVFVSGDSTFPGYSRTFTITGKTLSNALALVLSSTIGASGPAAGDITKTLGYAVYYAA